MKSFPQEFPRGFHYGFLLFAAVFLYLDLFVLPATPIFDPNMDHILYLYNATRMLDGQMIYRDFFQFTPPGTESVYLVIFKMVGVHAWVPNAMLGLLGTTLTGLCVFISRKILTGATAYLPGLMFLLLAFHPVLDAHHHWFSVLAVIAATALVMEKRTSPRVAGAGALLAVATFFTQLRGVASVAGLAMFLWWEHRRKPHGARPLWKNEALLTGVFSAAIVGLNLYFVRTVGLHRYLWNTVIFGVKYYPTDSPSNNFRAYMAFVPNVPHWYHPVLLSWFFIHALLPLIYLLFFVRYRREPQRRSDLPWDRLMLVSMMGFSLFLAVAAAPDYPRLCTVALPALIIFVWFLSSPAKLSSLARELLWAGTAVILVATGIRRQLKWRAEFDAPIGRMALLGPDTYERFDWLRSHARPGEFLFDARGEVYFPLGLKCPAQTQLLAYTDYMRPWQVDNVVDSLEAKHVPMVLWCPDFDAGAQGFQPGDHLGPLRAYLRSHYHQVKAFDNLVQVLERNDPPATGAGAIP